MPEREDLDLLGPVTAPEQDQELKDTAEDQVQDRPEHQQRGCPLREHARAMNLQLNSADPGFHTPQAARGVARRAPFAGLLTCCCWLSAWVPPLPRRYR
jgi:hypothetical protein